MANYRDDPLEVWVEGRMAALAPPQGWEPLDASVAYARLSRLREIEGTGMRWAWGLAAAALACVYVLMLPAPRVLAERCVDACMSETSRVGKFVLDRFTRPSLRGGAALKAVRERAAAPDFTLPDESGKQVRLSSLRGHVVLLNFWATWCSPCKAEIPWFMEYQQTLRKSGLVVLGVSMDDEGWKIVKPYVEEKKINYRIVVGTEEVAERYGGLDALPTTLLIDKAGRVAATHVGLVERKTYDDEIRSILAEK